MLLQGLFVLVLLLASVHPAHSQEGAGQPISPTQHPPVQLDRRLVPGAHTETAAAPLASGRALKDSRPSGIPVVVLATLGALTASAVVIVSTINSGQEPSQYVFPAVFGGGAAAGAVLGAAIGGRRPALLETLIGTAVGTLPLVFFSLHPDVDDGSATALGLAFPILGAWAGNTFGQPAARDGSTREAP